jgi:hypothetical protein
MLGDDQLGTRLVIFHEEAALDLRGLFSHEDSPFLMIGAYMLGENEERLLIIWLAAPEVKTLDKACPMSCIIKQTFSGEKPFAHPSTQLTPLLRLRAGKPLQPAPALLR